MNAKLLRFMFVGGICFSVNIVILFIGTEIFAWHYLSSMLVSIAFANTLGWLLNRQLTFGNSDHNWWFEYWRYMSASIASVSFSLVLMVFAVSFLGINYLVASAVIACLMLLLNYLVHRDWTFRNPDGSSIRS